MVGDQKSWLTLLIWAGIAIQFACLGVVLNNLTPNSALEGRGAVFRSPSFAGIARHPVSGAALVSSFFAQTGLWALAMRRRTPANLFLLAAGIALAVRAWRMLRDSPSPQPLPVPPKMVRLLALTPVLLVILAWFPRGARDGSEEACQGSGNSPHRIGLRNRAGIKAPSMVNRVFPGVLLYPVVKSTVRLIAPPSLEARGMTGSPMKPFLIPFDGVYWFWRFPGDRPPDTAVVKQGSPAKFIFHSTDGKALLMEAHQNLAAEIDLHCCSAIEVKLENADSRPDSIAVELLVRNTRLRSRPSWSLGVHRLTASASQILAFKIPRARSRDSPSTNSPSAYTLNLGVATRAPTSLSRTSH